MDQSKRIFGRVFVVILLVMVLITAMADVGIYLGLKGLMGILSLGADAVLRLPVIHVDLSLSSLEQIAESLKLLIESYAVWAIPASVVLCLLVTFIMWIFIRIGLSGVLTGKAASAANEKTDAGAAKDFADKRIEQERRRRTFLHMLSVLQRDGRLLDFFNEDLSLYEDDQIGAAVRSIHEECKSVVDKYISPTPVMDQEEGEIVEIAPGFDPDAVKLTGNVVGEPPFKGVLRHRGWKAAKKEIPKLADVMDSGIIVPAEVEIE